MTKSEKINFFVSCYSLGKNLMSVTLQNLSWTPLPPEGHLVRFPHMWSFFTFSFSSCLTSCTFLSHNFASLLIMKKKTLAGTKRMNESVKEEGWIPIPYSTMALIMQGSFKKWVQIPGRKIKCHWLVFDTIKAHLIKKTWLFLILLFYLLHFFFQNSFPNKLQNSFNVSFIWS